MRRGEIWWANIPRSRGSEPGYRRPVLIVQSDSFNASGIQTVVAVAFTSNLRLADAPGNVLCRKQDTDLSEDSVANISQLTALDKEWLDERVSKLPPHLFDRVEKGLRLVLGLGN
ncbi:MAG TPA: type II toxin-antitoxin system PemK/MazF family toxin [Terriglobia bacterium]|nr:type II toxin-antitoxin system PemK/MazF family toxin [Terriglobia bacterium]